MGGVDILYQRTVAYARLMKGVVWYYRVFFLHGRGVAQFPTWGVMDNDDERCVFPVHTFFIPNPMVV